MSVMTTAGSTFHVSATVPGTLNDAGYNGLGAAWILTGEVTDLGEAGRTYNMVNHNPVATRLTQKIKGSYDPGTISLQFGRDFSDAGQNLLFAASRSDATYAFKITLQNGKKVCFTGLVTSFSYSLGSVDQITAATCEIALQTDLIELAS